MRFDFYGSEKSRRVARAAEDRLHVDLERYQRNGDYGAIILKIDVRAGEPYQFLVTSEVSVKAENLVTEDV